MPGVHEKFQSRRPYLVDWEVIQIIVTIMDHIVIRITLNQCSGNKWLLLEAIVDLVHIYTYCLGDNVK